MDAHFFERAKAAGMRRQALETLAYQLGQFDQLSSKLQEDMLRSTMAELDTYVGGRWVARADATDLGTLEPAVATRLLLDLARTDRGDAGEDAIFPATLARDVVVWPVLLEIARGEEFATETREDATFWLGQMAGDAVAGDLEELTGDERIDLEVREAAVFALSELDGEEGIEALLRIARGSGDPRIREKAMFWLADSGDPRALALFEEILAGR